VLFKASKNDRHAEIYPLSDSPNDVVFDYAADGVRRSVENSLQRLGVDSLDIAQVHDISPDFAFFPFALLSEKRSPHLAHRYSFTITPVRGSNIDINKHGKAPQVGHGRSVRCDRTSSSFEAGIE
jgi:hypothetical protein